MEIGNKHMQMVDLQDYELKDLMRKINGITSDSRSAGKGWLFAALQGNKADGFSYIDDAVANGASVLLVDNSYKDKVSSVSGNFHSLLSSDPRRDLARLASIYFAPMPQQVVMITGTEGKSSTTDLYRQLQAHNNLETISVGTLGPKFPDSFQSCFDKFSSSNLASSLTTPDPVYLARILGFASHCGISSAVIEASSHGLDQHRLDGLTASSAGFTRLGHDHLDYHANRKDYIDAKLRLFSDLLSPSGTAVYNRACETYQHIKDICAKRSLRSIVYDPDGGSGELILHSVGLRPTGSEISAKIAGREVTFATNLFGRFQAENILCAAGLALAEGVSLDVIESALPKLEPVVGRMQPVISSLDGGVVMVDYAHAPLAFEVALRSARQHCAGRLWVVFGCGGDRDKSKRKIMGKSAAELADHVIVTDDNPRFEDGAGIRKEIIAGTKEGLAEILEEPDRASATKLAFGKMGEKDFLLVAGKGHETSQIIGDQRNDYSDHATILSLLPKKGWSEF